MKRRGKTVVIGCGILIGVSVIAFAASKLVIFNKPGGQQIGDWYGPVEVLAVEGEWAKVKMIGWMPKDQVAPHAPSGVRLEGSPGGGIWVSGISARRSFLGTQVTGWVTNATDKDFELLVLEIVFADAAGTVLDVVPVMVPNILDGMTKAFATETSVNYGNIANIEIQFSYGL